MFYIYTCIIYTYVLYLYIYISYIYTYYIHICIIYIYYIYICTLERCGRKKNWEGLGNKKEQDFFRKELSNSMWSQMVWSKYIHDK